MSGDCKRLQVGLQPLIGFVLAEDRLAQEVDVHADAFGVAAAKVLKQQFLLGRQDDVRRLLSASGP